jgi:hypothetical protein
MAKHRARPALPEGAREFFRQHGAVGGAIGGKRRFAAMTAEERSALAKRAADARWKKAKSKKR